MALFRRIYLLALVRNDAGELTSVTADGSINGVLNSTQLLGFWPNDFALGARNWIVNSMQGGEISNLKVHAAFDQNDIVNRQIANKHLNIKFDVTKGEVRYMRKMPWLRNATGYGGFARQSGQFLPEQWEC